jgi:hypothetical protein
MTGNEVPLKRKYLLYKPARNNRNGHSENAGVKVLHKPLTEREKALHAAQPRKVMILGANGRTRMELA